MKSKLSLLVVLFFSITFLSCNKDDDNQPIVPVVATPAGDGFSWSENGTDVVKTAPTSRFSDQYNTLYAIDASSNTVYEINLSNDTPGTYLFDSTNANALAYVIPGATSYFTADAGSVIITANANGKMSGTFRATGTAVNGVTSVSGTFTNINVVQ